MHWFDVHIVPRLPNVSTTVHFAELIFAVELASVKVADIIFAIEGVTVRKGGKDRRNENRIQIHFLENSHFI